MIRSLDITCWIKADSLIEGAAIAAAVFFTESKQGLLVFTENNSKLALFQLVEDFEDCSPDPTTNSQIRIYVYEFFDQSQQDF